MFSHSSSLLKGPFRRRLSTVNITSGQRPRRLWDMHLPEKNWRFVPRGLSLVRRDETRPNETGIPDENLPEPWTCDWRAWGLLPSWLNAPGGLQCRLIHKFNIGLYDSMRHCYVAPLMFRSTQSTSGTTVFHAHGTNGASFYLYDEPSDGVYRFEHDFPLQRGTAAEFMETANWNKMEYLGALGGASSVMESRPTPVKLGSDSCKWLRLRDLGQSEVRLLFQSTFFSDRLPAHPVEV
ncbi:hypothetical protein B0H11DRAFT_2094016 [Mycena galericulata]|nr:hypothetical protein B0H11DRAFT_2094016 [Mycena galericulata]